ncbi:TMV resistance protein N-like isoform X2 [Apium graveolens]|uniref:TMV resistance protein N-like isoform X2 n=1 Tax=Apium graveolens TaxID=4045 RepID=UPI003D7A194B
MFGSFMLWIYHLWCLLCDFIMPSAPNSQTPSISAPNARPTTTDSQTHPTFVSTCWDVFLSFRGEDTRNKFTSHLYQTLNCNGVRTFMDDPELRGGEVISDALSDAIRNSKAYIVVFSENYATSSWCLNELVEILNCHKTMQRYVIPVFFNIDPSVVRHQTGSFHTAFKKHQNRFWGEREKVKNWKLTLKQVANFSGHHISKDRSEAEAIKEIVDDLLLQISPKSVDVAKYPVGLDFHVKAITKRLSSESDKIGVIKFGIYGMGGVGKTTLAKALYNQLLGGGSFKGSSFLANVREISQTAKGVLSLQQQLIDDVLNSTTKFKVHNVEHGINLIRERISSAKVLILIDDIYDLEQYESLAGPFASGSVVIITTRDEEMLDKVNVETNYRYMLKVLDYAQSRELFTQYAFEKAEPPNNLLPLCEDILGLAGGLPLALKIFGSYLSTKKEVGWKSYIETLQQYPNSTIEQKLLISLDALELDDRMLKKILIDIACFFIGWNKEKAVKVLETYYSHADEKIDTLRKRCLLTVNEEELEMHDLLRDMGRNVARNKAPDEPGKYSRLWLPEDIEDVLKNYKGTEAIEGIIPHNLHMFNDKGAIEGKSFTTETFKRMSKLRFLYFEKVNLTGSFKHMFEDLRVLSWDCCPLKCLPSDFYPEKLVILELPQSNMKTMWDLNMVSHVFKKLKTLNMSYSQDLITTPNFIKLPSLETLNLEYCNSLKEVHMSIGSLVRLDSLNLEGCKKLRNLPDTICNLRALKVLNISKCNGLEALPIQLGNIKSLIKLNADGLSVSKLPNSTGHLTELVELCLNNNENLKALPDSICNQRSLEILNIADCNSLEALPASIGNLESLKKIIMDGLTISKLPDSIGSLTKLVELDISNNEKLETLPDSICNLRSLEILNIADCSSLEALPLQLGNIKSLKKLSADGLSLSKLPDSTGHLTKLVELCLNNNENLETLPDSICNQRSLEILNIADCSSLEALPVSIGNLESLKKIVMYGLTISKLPDSIGSLTKLVELDLSNNENLETLPDTICNLTALETLNIWQCSKLETLPDELWKITSLRKIYANFTSQLIELPDIGSSQTALALQELNLSFSGITALPLGLRQLSNLQSVELSYCPYLLGIPKLPPTLKQVKASGCQSLARLPNLSNLKHLEELCLSNCLLLTEIQGLEDLISIKRLYLGGVF